MLNNIAARYRAIREIEAKLAQDHKDEFFYMVSLEDPTRDMHGGAFVQVDRKRAATALVDVTHRMATTEEIEKKLAEDKRVRDRAEELAMRRELLGSSVVQQLNTNAPISNKGKGDK